MLNSLIACNACSSVRGGSPMRSSGAKLTRSAFHGRRRRHTSSTIAHASDGDAEWSGGLQAAGNRRAEARRSTFEYHGQRVQRERQRRSRRHVRRG
jgi:hypothetical protein